MWAIYGAFFPGYKRAEKTVPFPHWPAPSLPAPGIVSAILLFALVFLPRTAVHADTLTLEQLTVRMQEVYDRTTDMKAGFLQEVTIKAMKRTEREEGLVYFKNPRMMLWDYSRPKAKKLVINATRAWLYVPEDRMVYVQNADDVYRSRMAVKFLSGIGKLSDEFQIRFSKENPLDADGNYQLALTAKESGGGIDRLHLIVDAKTFQILQCRFNDAFGNTTRLRFSDIKINTGIPDKFFMFKTPDGVEELKMP